MYMVGGGGSRVRQVAYLYNVNSLGVSACSGAEAGRKTCSGRLLARL